MAKGLKIGDAVTVRKDIRLKRKDDAYKQGLKRLRNGQIGQIISQADGRSVVVEFEGKHVTLASQRLDRVEPPAAPAEAPVRRRGRRPGSAALAAMPGDGAAPATASTSSKEPTLIDYSNPQFIKTAANKLLTAPTPDGDDAVIIQVRMSDLPKAVQSRIKALIQAKLELTPQADAGSVKVPGRRGRKPKVQAS